MAADFIPRNDEAFLAFVQPYSSKVTATPVPLGLSASIATTLAGKVTTFSTALAAANDPVTRGPATILAKDNARRDLESYVRETARQVQGTMSVTDSQRQALGLPVRDTAPSPIPVPGTAPAIDILSVNGNTVRIRLHEEGQPTKRGKPAGVDGAAVFSFVGANPPSSEAAWKFETNLTKTQIDIVFPNTVAPGARVWFTAFWFNERKQSGPATSPVGTNIPGNAAMAA